MQPLKAKPAVAAPEILRKSRRDSFILDLLSNAPKKTDVLNSLPPSCDTPTLALFQNPS